MVTLMGKTEPLSDAVVCFLFSQGNVILLLLLVFWFAVSYLLKALSYLFGWDG